MKTSASILLVDDRKENLVALRAVLEQLGCELVSAMSGEEAIAKAHAQPFAVILLDVQMPGVDGFETARRLKESQVTRLTPIIFLTANYQDSVFIFRGYSHGAVDYLVKPLDADVLRAKVSVFIELFVARESARARAEQLRQHEIEDARRLSEARYQTLADAMPQIVWTASADGEINYCNQRFFEYAGAGHGIMDWPSILHPDEKEAVIGTWTAHLSGAKAYEQAFRLRRGHDGAYRWHLSRAIPERDATGSLVGWIGTCTDIEDQKLRELEARRAVESRDEFLSAASHELKTPLAALLLNVQLIDRALASEPAVRDKLGKRVDLSVRSAIRLDQLVTQMLDVSRITGKGVELRTSAVELGELVADVVERFAAVATDSGTVLAVHVEPAMHGVWDPMRIEQVVTNLLSNAVRYGDGKPVGVRVFRDSGFAAIEVTDQGIGIDAMHQERIFKRFEQAETRMTGGGLGLGLWIVKRIVEASGGSIALRSAVGQGSTFTVRLPLEAAAGTLQSQ